jgi:hypothetical protein
MTTSWKDLTLKLKELGLKAVKTIEKGVSDTRKSIESTILEDELHRRFNLENPYRFEIRGSKEKSGVLAGLGARNARRYLEDDLFVFYGDPASVGVTKGDIVKDLSDEVEYKVEEIVPVTMTVTLQEKEHDVPATAVKCRAL